MVENIAIRVTVDDKATKGLNKINRGVKGLGGRALSAAKSVGKLAIAATALAGAFALGAAVKAAIEFESTFAGVRKTVEATEAEFALLERQFRDLATTIPVSTSEINRIGEAAGQLGIRKENILDFTRVMADLGVTTNLSAEEAATSLARFSNITAGSQDDIDRLGSTIVELGNNLATTEAEIVEMGLRLAGAGTIVGLTQAEVLAFAGALSSVGLRAQIGGTSISRTFIKIAEAVRDTTGESDEILLGFANTAGMTAEDFRVAFEEDAAGALITFIEGMGNLEEAGGNVFAVLEQVELADIRVKDALLRAAGAGDLFRESIELGSKAFEENTALTEEAEKRYGTAASNIKVFKNNLTELAITVGEILLPAINVMLSVAIPVLQEAARGVRIFWERNGEFILDVMEDIINGADKFAVLFVNFFAKAFFAADTIVKTILNVIRNTVVSTFNFILDKVDGLLERIVGAINVLQRFRGAAEIVLGPRIARLEFEDFDLRDEEEFRKKFLLEERDPFRFDRSKFFPGEVAETLADEIEDELEARPPVIPIITDPGLDPDIEDALAEPIISGPAIVQINNPVFKSEINVQRIDDSNIEQIAERLNSINLRLLTEKTGILVGGF